MATYFSSSTVLGFAWLDLFSLYSAYELEIKYIVSACCEHSLWQNCPSNLELQEKLLYKKSACLSSSSLHAHRRRAITQLYQLLSTFLKFHFISYVYPIVLWRFRIHSNNIVSLLHGITLFVLELSRLFFSV